MVHLHIWQFVLCLFGATMAGVVLFFVFALLRCASRSDDIDELIEEEQRRKG